MYFPSTLSFVNVFTIVLILVFASILLAISLVHMIIFTANATSTITTATTATVNGVRIQAGGGNATAPWTIFLPQEIEINTGESITWYNPTEVAEPHTVTFVLDNNTMTGAT
ncbi:MAG TPA: hypothetical protein VFS97_08240 [Nitrososphaeraceae archaeon]|nr:hypothetical protein [Nitrososphaeraceae archaeon]